MEVNMMMKREGLYIKNKRKEVKIINMSKSCCTKETPSTFVYGVDVMLPVKLDTPTWRRSHFNKEGNKAGLRCSVDLMDVTRDIAHIQ